MTGFKFSIYLFKGLCIIATFVVSGMWINTYLLDEDISVIDNIGYFSTKEDVVPVLSLCFEQTFFERQTNSIKATNENGTQYLGSGWTIDTSIDYDNVTTNLSDYLLAYDVMFRNLSASFDITPFDNPYVGVLWKQPYVTYTWNSWGHIVKCFGIEILDIAVYSLKLYIKRDIFHNRIRPQNGGFAVLLHYPNQVLSSIQTVRRQWQERNGSQNYVMDFYLTNLAVALYRYKPRQKNCIQNWKEYDNVLLEDRIKSTGCKTPFQPKQFSWPICNNADAMQKAFIPIINQITAACREVKWIQYDMRESDPPANDRTQKWYKNWFAVALHILKPRFQITVQKKAVDFQSLIGYVGGYSGIFLGFALAQVPEMVTDIFIRTRNFYLQKFQRSTNIV